MSGHLGERLVRILKANYSPDTKPTLPDELLYDDIGLPIWNEIVMTPEFYQTHEEVALLDAHGAEIAARTGPGVTLFDIGAGYVPKSESDSSARFSSSLPAFTLLPATTLRASSSPVWRSFAA